MTQRLPTPGGDSGSWGDILNAYLEVSLNSDGTLANNTVGTSQIQSGAVTNAQLDSTTQTKLSAASTAVQSVNSKSGTSITLAASDVNAVPTSQLGAASGVATLDSGSHLTTSQLPSAVVNTSASRVYLGAPTGTDDAAINTAITAAAASPPMIIQLQAGATYTVSSTLVFQTGVWIDLNGGTIKLANGSNCDLFQTVNFATLTNGTSAAGPSNFGFIGPGTVDHNDANNTGWLLRFYGSTYGWTGGFINFANGSLWTEGGNGYSGSFEPSFGDCKVYGYSRQAFGWIHGGPANAKFRSITVATLADSLQPAVHGLVLAGTSWSAYTSLAAMAGNAAGEQIISLHTWGRNTGNGYWDASGSQVFNGQCEGAFLANVLFDHVLCQFFGEVYGTNGSSGSAEVGVQVGSSNWTVSRCMAQVLFFNFASGSHPFDFPDSGGSNQLTAVGQLGSATALWSTAAPNNDYVNVQCHDSPAHSIFQLAYATGGLANLSPGTLLIDPDTLEILPGATSGNVLTTDGTRATWQAAAASIVPGTWTALTLGTNISATAGYNTPSAALLGNDLLLLSGCITAGAAITNGATVFTLPSSSMYPTSKLAFASSDQSQSGDGLRFTINGGGVCQTAGGLSSGAIVPLDGIILRLN